METKVSVSSDATIILLTIPLSSMHPFAPVPPVPPVPPPTPYGIAAEMSVPIFWPPGWLMGKNKLTDTVRHRTMSIAQKDHDCGPGIIHIQYVPAPNNMLTVLHILTSKRKANFYSGEVKADGEPIANCILTNAPPTPMTSCGSPVSIPGTDAPHSHLNSVCVGIHPIDLIAGWVEVAVKFAFELASFRSAAAPEIGEGSESGLDHALSTISGWPGSFNDAAGTTNLGGRRSATATVPGFVGGLIRMSGQEWFGYHGDARVGVQAVSGPLTAGASVTRDGETHDWTVEATQGVTGPLGVDGATLSERVEVAADGSEVTGRVRATQNRGGLKGTLDFNIDGGSMDDESFDTDFDWPEL